jgi:hypothetical protein
MTEATGETSPLLRARIAGGLYLIVIVAGAFAEAFVRLRLVVNGNAAATARNILAHTLLYRLGFAANVLVFLCNVPLALIFYDLFKAVNRSLAALAAVFILVGTAIESVDLLNHYLPLILLEGGRNSRAFTPDQLQILVYTSISLHAVGFNLCLVFFACYDIAIGYLLFRSTFFPRTLGVLMAIAGLCYMTNSFANFLSPAFASRLFPYIQIPSGLGELALCLWLLLIGVNAPKWQKMTSTPAEALMDAVV